MYTFLAVFFFILALAGLFVGMVTAAWAKFQQFESLNFGILYGTSTFNQCMLGRLVGIFRDLFGDKVISASMSAMALSGKIWFVFYLFLVFAVTFSAILAFALMIITIVTKSTSLAKNCAMTSGIVLFLVYGGYFLLTYAVGGLIDAPAALIGGLVLVTLIAVAIIRSKVYGLLSSLLLVLTVIAIMMLNYSDASITRLCSLSAFNLYKDADKFLGIMVPMLVVVLAFNFVASALRIAPKRYFVFDAVRYGVQLLVVILTIVAFLVRSKTLFGDTWAIFTDQTLATVLLLVCSIATFVVALLETLLVVKQEPAATQEVVVADRQPMTYEPAYVRVAPMENYAPVIQPVVVAQPVYQQPAYQQPTYQQPVYQQPAPQPAPQPAETHVYVQQPERPDVPVTEFERKMQSLARGNSSVYDASPIPASGQRVNVETQNAYDRQRKTRAQNPSSNSYIYEGSQYVYDPFIKTLSVQERNEFGDLFIANIYGLRSYLPTYVIGGDNKLFFDRVFIYLGCYRNYISQELLEKIYLYVSKQ